MYTVEFPQEEHESLSAFIDRYMEWLSSLKGKYFTSEELAVTVIKNMNKPTRTYFDSVCGDLSVKSGDEVLEFIELLALESVKPGFSLSLADNNTVGSESMGETLPTYDVSTTIEPSFDSIEGDDISKINKELGQVEPLFDGNEGIEIFVENKETCEVDSMSSFDNPFFHDVIEHIVESWDREDEDTFDEILEAKWDAYDGVFEEHSEEDYSDSTDFSTPCIWDDAPIFHDIHIDNPPCEFLIENVEEESHDKIDGIEDPLRVTSLGSLTRISFSSTRLDLVPSFPLLHPPTCLNSLPLYAYDSSDVYVHDLENCEPPIMLFGMSFENPPFDVGWGDLFMSHASYKRAFKVQQRSLTFMLHAYTLLCGYLCFCVAHAQVFDRLLRALTCFNLSYCAY